MVSDASGWLRRAHRARVYDCGGWRRARVKIDRPTLSLELLLGVCYIGWIKNGGSLAMESAICCGITGKCTKINMTVYMQCPSGDCFSSQHSTGSDGEGFLLRTDLERHKQLSFDCGRINDLEKRTGSDSGSRMSRCLVLSLTRHASIYCS